MKTKTTKSLTTRLFAAFLAALLFAGAAGIISAISGKSMTERAVLAAEDTYSLSAGGPIIHPQSKVFVLTAVAPHSLNMRPIVLSDDKEITLNVESRNGRFLIAVDGNSQSYPVGTVVHVRQAPFPIKVVKQEGNTYFNTLRKKMMWGVSSR